MYERIILPISDTYLIFQLYLKLYKKIKILKKSRFSVQIGCKNLLPSEKTAAKNKS